MTEVCLEIHSTPLHSIGCTLLHLIEPSCIWLHLFTLGCNWLHLVELCWFWLTLVNLGGSELIRLILDDSGWSGCIWCKSLSGHTRQILYIAFNNIYSMTIVVLYNTMPVSETGGGDQYRCECASISRHTPTSWLIWLYLGWLWLVLM